MMTYSGLGQRTHGRYGLAERTLLLLSQLIARRELDAQQASPSWPDAVNESLEGQTRPDADDR